MVILIGGFAVVYNRVSEDRARSVGERDLGSGSAADPYRWWINVPAGHTKQSPTDFPGYTPSATPNAGQVTATVLRLQRDHDERAATPGPTS
ncbi:hypothetical protein ABZU76_38555 [Amycolatopsis sp. NPDC005232]|uniref:hypothetical protein n=1 Tax=Amycolatopsis sp. NPDC005232 TaxID=3157027 RepID=UPI0033AB9E36